MTRLHLGIALFVSTAALSLPVHLTAQAPGVRAGDDVRIRSESVAGRFTVSDVTESTLTLRDSDGAIVLVPAGSVTRLAVHRGPRSRGRGALRGLGIGFAAGAVGGALLGLADGDDSGGIINFTAEEKALMGATVFGVTGGLLGAAIGAAAPGQLWEKVPFAGTASVGATRDGGMAIGYSLRF